ncbi:chitobiosyldiphosphodolichol beta-mannosyltransferase [Ditylenchus destructor]|nr:chitobiosyldiphosphodolichol beta-mannosyltransferase [Ditylenchus destructor]
MDRRGSESDAENNAIVVVMGDIGRSPRMCYHALSLANHGYNVELVGYAGTKPHIQILSHPRIRLVRMQAPPDAISQYFPRLLSLIIKFGWIQVRLASTWEGYWGQKADWNLCVSKAMQKDLRQRWGIKALTVYDKAPAWIFRPLSIEEQHNFLAKLMKTSDFSNIAASKHWQTGSGVEDGGEDDEDFGILLDALRDYEKQAQSVINQSADETDALPKLLVVITGKGPQKEFYLGQIAKMRMQYVHVVTAWLAAEDYPKILACANLGLDLPMKVVDMFGCHLPVLAKKFDAINELIVDGATGKLFDNSQELKQDLIELAAGFPKHSHNLHKLKKNLSVQPQATWDEQWDAACWPLIVSLSQAQPHIEMSRWQRFQNEEPANNEDQNLHED